MPLFSLTAVTRGYCDKTAKDKIMQFHTYVAQCLSSLPAKFDYDIQKESP